MAIRWGARAEVRQEGSARDRSGKVGILADHRAGAVALVEELARERILVDEAVRHRHLDEVEMPGAEASHDARQIEVPRAHETIAELILRLIVS